MAGVYKVLYAVLDCLLFLTGQRIVKRLRTTLFSSILKQETAFFDKTRTGELINRLSSDTALLGRSLTENLSDGLRAGAQASVGVGMMVGWSPPYFLLLTVSSLFCFCLVTCECHSVQQLSCVLGSKCISLVINVCALHCKRSCAIHEPNMENEGLKLITLASLIYQVKL